MKEFCVEKAESRAGRVQPRGNFEKADALIRKFKAEDFTEITALFRQLWPGKSLNHDRLRGVFLRMTASGDYELLCAEKDGRVTGFASLAILQNLWQEGPIMYITTMIVEEKHRRKGIGRSLISAAAEIARKRGCSRIELESAFHRSDAHDFYEKTGFEKRAYFFSKDILI